MRDLFLKRNDLESTSYTSNEFQNFVKGHEQHDINKMFKVPI